jgi:hypothetical protein
MCIIPKSHIRQATPHGCHRHSTACYNLYRIWRMLLSRRSALCGTLADTTILYLERMRLIYIMNNFSLHSS